MKILKALGIIVVIVGIIVVWAAPIGPMPGIFIGGSSTPVPTNWGDTRPIHEVKLEVGEGLIPRVVIIWVVQVDGKLHVVGAKDSGWTQAIGTQGPVRLRMGDQTYAMQAKAIDADFERILTAYVDKYRADYPEIIDGFPPIEEARSSVAVFQLAAR